MKRCAKCPKAPVVGVGNPVQWLCMTDYVEWLREQREARDAARHAHQQDGQTLRHAHPDGGEPHGYYGHPEDIGSQNALGSGGVGGHA